MSAFKSVVHSRLSNMRSTCRARPGSSTEEVTIKIVQEVVRKWQPRKITLTKIERKLQNEPRSVCDSGLNTLFIHSSICDSNDLKQTAHNWHTAAQVKLRKLSRMYEAAICLKLILPGGWLFLTLWHPESRTGQRTSWCLCLLVETLWTVKYIQQCRVLVEKNLSLSGHS